MKVYSTPQALSPTVHVTRQAIQESKRADSSHCMIAEAIKKAVPDASFIAVDLQTIRFTNKQKKVRYTYLTPRKAQLALVDFDQGVDPKPFQFMLKGGQVTLTPQGKKEVREATGLVTRRSDAQNAASRRAIKKAARVKLGSRKLQNLRKATVRFHADHAPARTGGRTPPTTPFARRREFGLRALAR